MRLNKLYRKDLEQFRNLLQGKQVRQALQVAREDCIFYLQSLVKFICFAYLILMISIPVRAEVESDEAKFIAKEKENTLKIINYKSTVEDRRRAEEERRKQEEKDRLDRVESQKRLNDRKRQEELARLEEERRLKEEEDRKKEEERRRQLELERLREEQRLKLAQERARIEEEKRKRLSKFRLVRAGERDNVNLATARTSFYMEDYSELGTPEDITSSPVIRDNITTTDMYVRLLIETNINSRRAGEYVAVVEKDVFSFDSKEVLIPKGSKFVCVFDPLQAYGATALNSECKRVYFPDGKSMMITSAFVSDVMGRAGMIGELDNRMWEKYGQTVMLSGLSGLAMLGADRMTDSEIGSLAQYTALNTIDLSTKFLEKTIDLAPVVTIASGTRIIVKLQVDVNLEPIEN